MLDRRSRASMRPRVFPAEDAAWVCQRRMAFNGFNEAAGIPRGRPEKLVTLSARGRSFNEAAGIPRGRRGYEPPLER